MKSTKPAFNIMNRVGCVISFAFIISLTGCNNSPKEAGTGSKVTSPDTTYSTVNNVKAVNPVPVRPVTPDSLQAILKGKWLRSDGTYIVEIFSVKEGGKMDAGYLNPNPINVGSSAWLIADGNILVEIVLKDANYPGSKYNLIYDREKDILYGNYFQAVQGINYDVMFTRNK
jgi:hypothetical protein